jgi:hypothetical protein
MVDPFTLPVPPLTHLADCKKLFPAIDEWHDQLAAKEQIPHYGF